ncbi:MAG: gamma carbonic anhydrase family protein [Candidatus Helarchaeota archaeon]
MPVYELRGKTPQIDESAFVSEQASIIGDVKIGPQCSVWPGTIIRGDAARITLNECVHVQDAVIIHSHQNNAPVEISSFCTIETGCAIYGCFIGEACVVGTGSIIFDNVTLSEGVLLAPNSFVPNGMIIQPRVVMKSDQPGIPVATVRKLSMEEITAQRDRAERYAETFQKLGKWFSKVK